MSNGPWLSRLKDRALARAVRIFLNRQFSSLGRITELRLDTGSRVAEIDAELAGESLPIHARVAYRIEESEGRLFFLPVKIECSRAWVEEIAVRMMSGSALRIPIPGGLATVAVKALRV